MPIKIPDNLPAKSVLENENIFVMTEYRALHQDIRPLRIAIVNLMPTKIATETQLMRLLGNTPLQVDIDLIMTDSYKSKNTSEEHISSFYKTFPQVRHLKYDGMIITGAPVEFLEFELVAYWNELCEIMEWSKTNVTSTFHICWAAQAALNYHYGVQKHVLDKKMFGVFEHTCEKKNVPLLRGMDDVFYAPHSRHTTVYREDIEKVDGIEILSTSEIAGVYIAASTDGKQIFVTGHSEYDRTTLQGEYLRDIERGMEIDMPYNYFPGNNSENEPDIKWRSHANLLYSNWLNYYVYQTTPYDIEQIK